jgi:DNA-binding NarL/FixJ family response regulator
LNFKIDKMIRVAIADDHQLVIDGVQLMLEPEEDMQLVYSALNGQELLSILKTNEIDLVLLDVNMPVLNGLDTCKKINQDFPNTKVIGLSMMKEVSLIKLMLQYGANGFLLKNAGKDEVVDAIRKVYNGQNYYSTEVSDIVMNSLNTQNTKPLLSHPFPQLSRREKQVLQLIVDEFTTSEIAEKLFISFGTVETHRRNILSKLGARNTAGIVRIAIEYNLLS